MSQQATLATWKVQLHTTNYLLWWNWRWLHCQVDQVELHTCNYRGCLNVFDWCGTKDKCWSGMKHECWCGIKHNCFSGNNVMSWFRAGYLCCQSCGQLKEPGYYTATHLSITVPHLHQFYKPKPTTPEDIKMPSKGSWPASIITFQDLCCHMVTVVRCNSRKVMMDAG